MDSAYPDMQPGDARTVMSGAHLIRVVATRAKGFHSDRTRYLVACETCSELLHVATTGPECWIETHVRESVHKAECVTPTERMTGR